MGLNNGNVDRDASVWRFLFIYLKNEVTKIAHTRNNNHQQF